MELFVTLVIFIILIVGIMKKVELKTLMLSETLLMLLYSAVFKGSVMGDATSGNVFMDCFSYISSYIDGNIGGIVLSIIVVSAYVEVMNHLNATDTLAALICRPVSKIKSPYIIAGIMILIAGLLRTCITSGPAAVILLIATFYPVMLRCGCSIETSCVAILIANAICWGPADPIDLTAAQLMGVDINFTVWFVQYQLPVFAIIFIVMILVYQVSARLFDKKKGTYLTQDIEADAAIKAPAVYALFPILPLIFMLVFSPFLISSISIDVVTACLLSITLVILAVALTRKSAASAVEIINQFFGGFGDVLKGLGLTVLLAMLFASALNSIGGMQIIAQALMGLNIPSVLLVLVHHFTNPWSLSTCYLHHCRVGFNRRCHRIASFSRLALTQISGTY